MQQSDDRLHPLVKKVCESLCVPIYEVLTPVLEQSEASLLILRLAILISLISHPKVNGTTSGTRLIQ